MDKIRHYVRIVARLSFIPLLVFIIFLSLYIMAKFLLPFLMALIIALLSEPLIKRLQKVGLGRAWSAAIAMIGVYSASIFIAIIVLVSLSEELVNITRLLPAFISETFLKINHLWTLSINKLPDPILPYVETGLSEISKVGVTMAQKTAGWIFSIFSLLPLIVIVIVFTMIASYFIAKDKDEIFRWFMSFFTPHNQKTIRAIGWEIYNSVIKFLKAQAILMTITFIITLTGLMIIGVNYILLASFMIAIFDILPILGPGGIFAPWAIYYLISGQFSTGLMILVLYGIVFFTRQFMQPKILANTMELPALPLLMSLYLGMVLFGVIGLIISPFVLVVYFAIKKVRQGKDEPIITLPPEITL